MSSKATRSKFCSAHRLSLYVQKLNNRHFGGEKYHEVNHTSIWCHVFDGIECQGNRSFLIENASCVKYSSHCFVSTLFYSIFLGLFAVDRFSLGHIGVAVGKMITLGGLGLWWIIDVALLIFGKLMPQDESNWIVQRWIWSRLSTKIPASSSSCCNTAFKQTTISLFICLTFNCESERVGRWSLYQLSWIKT